MIIPISLMTQPRQRDFWLKLSCPKLYSGRLPRWLSGKELVCQHRRGRFDPWVGKIPRRRKWLLIPVFLPGESHGQRGLVLHSPYGHKESDITEVT